MLSTSTVPNHRPSLYHLHRLLCPTDGNLWFLYGSRARNRNARGRRVHGKSRRRGMMEEDRLEAERQEVEQARIAPGHSSWSSSLNSLTISLQTRF
jgi:hypothetical protein